MTASTDPITQVVTTIIEDILEEIVADQDTLNTLMQEFDVALVAVISELSSVQAQNASLQQQVTSLQAQLAAATKPAAPIDFAPVNAELAKLQAIVPPQPAPEPVPAPAV
jgi:hypothetical protein